MAKQPKLKALLEDIFNEQPQINKYEVTEGVRSYGIVGKTLYNNGNIMEIANQLSHIAEQAHTHVVSETDDWFDQVSVNKNMKTLKGSVAEFKKAAVESHQLNQRLTGLYEDIGHVLNRYYEIDEADQGDMDGDGKSEPDSEEYLDSKRDAITKAVKGEAVGDPDNRDMVDKPNSPDKDGMDNENESLDPDNTDLIDQPADPAKDGEEMKEIKRSLKDVGGVVGIPALGQIARKFTGK
jgi:hypothetical protein